METSPLSKVTVAFILVCLSALMVYLYRGSRNLQMALMGKDGYRLATVFVRVFAIDAVAVGLGVIRWLLEAIGITREPLLPLSAVAWALVAVGHAWALLSVRAIARSNDEEN